MKGLCTIEPLPGRSGAISLPGELTAELALVPEVFLAFGCRQAPGRLVSGPPAPAGQIQVSRDLIEQLLLPTGVPLRVRASGRLVRIGPVVGILAGRTHDQFTPDRLRTLSDHLLHAEAEHGLFVAFPREGIDLEQGRIDGYRFAAQTGKPAWDFGRFVMPQVIFRRFGVPLGDQLEPLRAMGVQVINERIFDKWEAAQWMGADPYVRQHIPETVTLDGVPSVLEMLRRHPCVYVKPIWGSQGKKILRVKRTGSGFTLDVSGEGQITCEDPAGLSPHLARYLPSPGIVQQGLTLASAGGRLVDFRVMLLRDGRGRWTVPGIVARCGDSGHYLSNMATGGFPLPAEEALPLLFGRGSTRTFRRMQELADLGLAAGAALDRSGLLLGDLGVDMAYDLDDRPWVIEVNNRYPDHSIGWESGQWPIFYQARSLPMAYACHLAGFSVGEVGGA